MEHRNSSPTPEKQLLKLIEQPGAADQQKETLKRRSIAFLSPSAIRGRISFFKKRAKGYFTVKKAAVGAKGINRILAFCVLVLAAYLAMDVINAIGKLKQTIELEAAPREESVEDVSRSSVGKLHYVERVRSRDIFDFASQWKPSDDEAVIALPTKKTKKEIMREMLNGVKLVAISFDPAEPLALIGDKEGVTRFRKEGDTINGVKIIKIFESNVLMGYEGEEEFLKR